MVQLPLLLHLILWLIIFMGRKLLWPQASWRVDAEFDPFLPSHVLSWLLLLSFHEKMKKKYHNKHVLASRFFLMKELDDEAKKKRSPRRREEEHGWVKTPTCYNTSSSFLAISSPRLVFVFHAVSCGNENKFWYYKSWQENESGKWTTNVVIEKKYSKSML